MPTTPAANQWVVFRGVMIGMAIAAIPFAFKAVWEKENQLASIRDGKRPRLQRRAVPRRCDE